jgi:hypothetical protein
LFENIQPNLLIFSSLAYDYEFDDLSYDLQKKFGDAELTEINGSEFSAP